MAELVPPISVLKANYPSPYKYDNSALYGALGIIPMKDSENTCALRMSVCLLLCDIKLGKEPKRGRETLITKDPLKDKYVWLSRANLSRKLEKIFGKPTCSFASSDKDKGQLESYVKASGGIISYGKLAAEGSDEAYPGGHIDVAYWVRKVHYIWGRPIFASDDFMLAIGHDWDMMFRRAETIKFWASGV